jgi:hypothetical protein
VSSKWRFILYFFRGKKIGGFKLFYYSIFQICYPVRIKQCYHQVVELTGYGAFWLLSPNSVVLLPCHRAIIRNIVVMLGKAGLCMPLSYIFTKLCTSHLLTSILVVFFDVLSVYMIQYVFVPLSGYQMVILILK